MSALVIVYRGKPKPPAVDDPVACAVLCLKKSNARKYETIAALAFRYMEIAECDPALVETLRVQFSRGCDGKGGA